MNDEITIDDVVIWMWDEKTRTWRKDDAEREYVVVDVGIDILQLIASLSAARFDTSRILVRVWNLVWTAVDATTLTATLANGWALTFTEDDEGYVVTASCYGEAETRLPFSPLHEALAGAVQWANRLWIHKIEDGEGYIWEWDRQRKAFVTSARGCRFEVFYVDGGWKVREIGSRNRNDAVHRDPETAAEFARLL